MQVYVGDSLDAIGQRVVDAWHGAEEGELTAADAEIHIGFATWEMMVRVLSPKRLELLRHLHRTPARNIKALATALGRDYRRVHEDVETLGKAGLLERDADGVRADYEAFDVNMRVAL